jgi:type IV pilus assembly protein PilY1
VTSNNPVVNPKRGWYLDLVSPVAGFQGEMSVTDPVLRNGRVIFTTTIPTLDICDFGGTSWLMELDALSGSRLDYTPFDLNNDKKFSDLDFATITLPDGTKVKVPVSGLASDAGLTPKPAVVAGDNAEYAITPDTSGNIEVRRQNPGPNGTGRQSWKQIR